MRTGALYLDPATGDVWFHPWGGDPRIVGHNSTAAPAGTRTAISPPGSRRCELVVYDTAAGREISRTELSVRHGTELRTLASGGEHVPRVTDTCRSPPTAWSGNLRRKTSTPTSMTCVRERFPRMRTTCLDVYDDAAVSYGGKEFPSGEFSEHLVLRMPGQPQVRYNKMEPRAKFSPSGTYLLARRGKS